jgi:hypothetical protein
VKQTQKKEILQVAFLSHPITFYSSWRAGSVAFVAGAAAAVVLEGKAAAEGSAVVAVVVVAGAGRG